MLCIFLACQDGAFCDRLRSFLDGATDFEVCGEAGNDADAIKAVLSLRPNLIILETEFRRDEDLDLAETVKKLLPNVTLFLVVPENDVLLERDALRRGADAVFRKEDDMNALLMNARAMLEGGE